MHMVNEARKRDEIFQAARGGESQGLCYGKHQHFKGGRHCAESEAQGWVMGGGSEYQE